jgi:Xaa-Pro dipeptidase
MSGPNSAQAYAAFQQTRSRTIAEGDFVLLHCNSYYGGFWTDITRTFLIGRPDAQKAAITGVVLEASREAISAVRPGIRTSAVDEAAREVLNARGYGKAFKHATGHGVGFAAIDHNALPRIHPLSGDILEPGMVFNIEPAVYIPGMGGMRHCNMVAVTDAGAELITGFQNETRDLTLH